ncbi:MAG TPA: glycosyltransferase family 61 protein [Acidimicrobiales bacterium]|nr:glycosyltransferase family 61 protein [Acidimicrobiales bacterium]
MTRLPTPLRPLFPLVKRTVVRSTELVGPVVRHLPASPTRPRPPRHLAESTEDYTTTHPTAGVELQYVAPRIERSWAPPPGIPAGHFVFDGHRRRVIPPAFVARLPRGRVVGSYGAVVTDDDTLLFDLSPYYGAFRAAQHPISLRWRLPPPEDLDGTVAVLTTRGVDNYYHFLTDVLPRLELLRRAGAGADRYVVERRTRFQRELLDRLAVTDDVALSPSAHPHVRAERLVAASLPDSHLQAPPWMVAWLRDTLLPESAPVARRRLYVTRGHKRNTRRVENEDAVLKLLAPYGFEVVDPGALSVAEQIDAFAGAELVVGPHGAGLTNIVFCPAGATVVELFPPDYVNVCYWNLASAVDGLRYRYLVNGPVTRRRGAQLGVASDVTVDLDGLRTLVEDALAQS